MGKQKPSIELFPTDKWSGVVVVGGIFIGAFSPKQVLRALRWRAVNSSEQGEFGLNALRIWRAAGSALGFLAGSRILPTAAFVLPRGGNFCRAVPCLG